MQKRIYLDYNATAPVLPEVVKKVTQVLTHNWANPSSTHTNGRKAKLELEESREAIAASIGVPARELHLTSGGTEAANLAVIGTCIPKGPGHIICSAIEHPAVVRLPCLRESRRADGHHLDTPGRMRVVNRRADRRQKWWSRELGCLHVRRTEESREQKGEAQARQRWRPPLRSEETE